MFLWYLPLLRGESTYVIYQQRLATSTYTPKRTHFRYFWRIIFVNIRVMERLRSKKIMLHSVRLAEWKGLKMVFQNSQPYSWDWRMECCFASPEVRSLTWVCTGQNYNFLAWKCHGHNHRPQKLENLIHILYS